MSAEKAVEINNSNWVLASEAYGGAKERTKERWIELLTEIGSIALNREVELGETGNNLGDATLQSAIRLASEGDERSMRMVRTNVATDLYERNYKTGVSPPVRLEMVDGSLEQEGRKVTQIHQNTLKHTVLIPEMHRRSTQEMFNVMYLEELFDEGAMEDYDALFFSPTSTNMTVEQKKDYNFFLATESMSIQRFSFSGKQVELETALVAGKATPESERQDINAIKELTVQNGIPVTSSDGTEILSYMMLVPKGTLKNGVVDVVKQYDDITGTFFGEAKPKRDYEEYTRYCIERHRQFDGLVEKITAQLIKESTAFDTPLEAIMRLDEISERLSVKHAIKNHDIDARMFGNISARHIEEARLQHLMGDYIGAQSSYEKALSTAESGSCPLFKRSTKEGSDKDKDQENPFSMKALSSKKWMNCPHCKARVYADPCASVLSCYDCSARVENGIVTSTGNGGAKKRAEKLNRQNEMIEGLLKALGFPGPKAKEKLAHQTDSKPRHLSAAGV